MSNPDNTIQNTGAPGNVEINDIRSRLSLKITLKGVTKTGYNYPHFLTLSHVDTLDH